MGGIAQGLGQVLIEDKSYDETGQLLTGSFMDYAMPRADDFCAVVEENPVPTATNPLGVKGAGEAGTVGSLSAGVNAIVDALSVLGIKHIDTPCTTLPSVAGDRERWDVRHDAEDFLVFAHSTGCDLERFEHFMCQFFGPRRG